MWLREGRRCPTFTGMICSVTSSKENVATTISPSLANGLLFDPRQQSVFFAARAQTSQQAAEIERPCCRLLDNTDPSFDLVLRQGGWNERNAYKLVRVHCGHAPKNGGRISFYVCHVQGLMCTVAHIMTAVPRSLCVTWSHDGWWSDRCCTFSALLWHTVFHSWSTVPIFGITYVSAIGRLAVCKVASHAVTVSYRLAKLALDLFFLVP